MLQQARLVSGLTRRELAARLETDQKYIWGLENGKNAIVLERIFATMRETGMRIYREVPDGGDASSADFQMF